jgi:hypothetical protein
LLLRVHATLLLLTSYTSKDVAESAFRSTHPSSTVAWGATPGQDELRRIYLMSSWVNKGKKKGQGYWTPTLEA